MGRLVINGDEIYELDEDCLKEKHCQNLTGRQFFGIENSSKDSVYMPGHTERSNHIGKGTKD